MKSALKLTSLLVYFSESREETIRFKCIVEYRELASNMAMDTKPALQELSRKVISEFTMLNAMSSLSLDTEHELAWGKVSGSFELC